MILRWLLIISFIVTVFFKTKRNIHMLQQNLYNENNRYLKWIVKNAKQFLVIDIFLILISLIGVLVVFDLEKFTSLCYFVLVGVSLFASYFWYKIIASDQNKKPLVITKRVKRLLCTISLFYLIPIILYFCNIDNMRFAWVMILMLSLMTYFNQFVIFIANIVNHPIERCVYRYYRSKAQQKLKNMNNLKVIGITGSYGKTSSKNILSDILNVRYNALPTPRNLNTHYGLIMTVNNHMDKFCDVFIAEMGAYVKGEIKQLCDLVKPKYGILTKIGTAHLETFGSEENIVKSKFELIESLPSDGFAVLNGDDSKQVEYELKNDVRTIWIGINNKNVDYRAFDIKCSNKGMSFKVKFKEVNKTYDFQTKLLGEHNIYNILAAVACGVEFGIAPEELVSAVKMVKSIEHRLELKKLGRFYQIDDAYNSNPVGANNACDVLKMMPGIKVVVTPGMIELGEKEQQYNKAFGKKIAEVADYVVLIGEKKTKPIYEGLLEKGFNKEKIVIFNDVRKAYPFIDSLTGNEDVYALFENDLPDTYNE